MSDDEEAPPGIYWDLRTTIPEIMDAGTVFESKLAQDITNDAHIGTIRNRAFTDPHTRITVSPSELSECLRKTILMRHYEVPELTNSQIKSYAEMERMAQEGHTLHDQAISALQSQGHAIVAELRLEDAEVPSSMRLDGFYEATDGEGASYVLEIKTMANMQYKEAYRGKMPRVQDFLQLQYYMHMTDMDIGLLMIIDRGYGGLFTLTMTYDDAIVDHVYERFYAIRTADEDHRVVGRVFPPSYWKCQLKSCVMTKICKAIGPEPTKMECASE